MSCSDIKLERLKEKLFFVSKIDNNNICSICSEDITEGDIKNNNVCKTECLHVFHFDCLYEWLKISNYCCLCKHTIYNSEEKDNYFDDVNIEFEIREESDDDYDSNTSQSEESDFDNPINEITEKLNEIKNKWKLRNIYFPISSNDTKIPEGFINSEKLNCFKQLLTKKQIDYKTVITKELINSYKYTDDEMNIINDEMKLYKEFFDDKNIMAKYRFQPKYDIYKAIPDDLSWWSCDSLYEYCRNADDALLNFGSIYAYEFLIRNMFEPSESNMLESNFNILEHLDNAGTYLLTILANLDFYSGLYYMFNGDNDGDDLMEDKNILDNFIGKTVEKCLDTFSIDPRNECIMES